MISYKSKYVKHIRKSFKINRFHQNNISNTFHADKKRVGMRENEILLYRKSNCCVARLEMQNMWIEHQNIKSQSEPFKHNKQWHFHLCDVKGKIQNNESSTIKKEANQDPGAGKTFDKFIWQSSWKHRSMLRLSSKNEKGKIWCSIFLAFSRETNSYTNWKLKEEAKKSTRNRENCTLKLNSGRLAGISCKMLMLFFFVDKMLMPISN